MHVATRLEPREFEDSEGRKQRRIDIVCQADDISLCGARRDPASAGSAGGYEADRGLDFVQGLADIRVGLQLDPHGCHPRAATGLTALISSSDSTCSSILTMIDSSTSSA